MQETWKLSFWDFENKNDPHSERKYESIHSSFPDALDERDKHPDAWNAQIWKLITGWPGLTDLPANQMENKK